MKLCFSQLLMAISYGLDCVERDLVGVATNHSKRVANMCCLMGKSLGMDEWQLSDLAACALLHDNALTEFIQAEYLEGVEVSLPLGNSRLGLHCTLGERNTAAFPFFGDVRHAILYHHESPDGSGPFGKTAGEIPRYAALIHMCDKLDSEFGLYEMTEDKYRNIMDFITDNMDILFSGEEVRLFQQVFGTMEKLKMEDEHIEQQLAENIPFIEEEYTSAQLRSIGEVFARIVDYKSTFTSSHSLGIAKKAYEIGGFYGYDEEIKGRLFLAGALHDIGKLAVDTEILEKPGKLTAEEFTHMKDHAYITCQVLGQIQGFEELSKWAGCHHEKLNGKGYPFGYGADKLGFFERLMGCLDIYQALREARPYKKGKSHKEAMDILYTMAEDGFIDGVITKDIDQAFCMT